MSIIRRRATLARLPLLQTRVRYRARSQAAVALPIRLRGREREPSMWPEANSGYSRTSRMVGVKGDRSSLRIYEYMVM